MEFKVLLVDDNVNNRFTVNSILDSMDVVVIEAQNGSEALEIMLRESVDLILLDIQLPDIDGFEVAKMIKSKKSTRAIPIIFTTAIFKSEEFIKKGYDLGAIDYLMKPIKVKSFMSKIDYYRSIALERKELNQEIMQKNIELQEKVHVLMLTEEQLTSALDNWTFLGNNVPFSIEIYNEANELTFKNKKSEDAIIGMLHNVYGKRIATRIERTFITKKNSNEVFNINNNQIFLEVKYVYIGSHSPLRVMLIISDISIKKKYYDDITYIGFHDQLTGLWNRHYISNFIDKTRDTIEYPLSVMMGDVNGLKLINDGFGHTAGDELIRTAATCFKACTPDSAIIARWGGDEFLILLPGVNESEASDIHAEISRKLEGKRIGDKIPVSIAVGSVTTNRKDTDFEKLIKEAEDKMYISKMQNQSSYRSFIVESLKKALFEQDYETKEHTERISNLALNVAEHLKLSDSDKNKLILLGSLHDIGKIAISSSILNYEGKLSKQDWETVKRHPEIGYRICVNVPELSSIAELILYHHERWDGSGYPRGLKGSEIPMLSRLISILDSFDVMTHDRPYKEKKSVEWALEELKRCSGKQFDPNLVHVFEHVLRQEENNEKQKSRLL